MGPAHTQLSFRHPALRPKAKEKPRHCWNYGKVSERSVHGPNCPSTLAVVDSCESRAHRAALLTLGALWARRSCATSAGWWSDRTSIRYKHGLQLALAEVVAESGAPKPVMSALPPKADMCSATRDVRFVPIADINGVRRPVFGVPIRIIPAADSSWQGRGRGCQAPNPHQPL